MEKGLAAKEVRSVIKNVDVSRKQQFKAMPLVTRERVMR